MAQIFKDGMLLLIGSNVYKVISSELRGSAQAHKIIHRALKSIPEGHDRERTNKPGEKVEQIVPARTRCTICMGWMRKEEKKR